jgi:hypothetical protein
VTAIDRQQVIEDTAKAIHDTLCIFHRDGRTQIGCYGIEQRSETDAMLALPVIVAAVLKPIRELHREQFQFCRDCDADYPCPTIQLCDEIESSAKGGE